MKQIIAKYKAAYTDMSGLDTYRVMPSQEVAIDALEPFLFLNHHGPQVYPANNRGLPFGPHPHKGFETVTFIIDGDIVHTDSTGYNSKIGAGGIQWMTAGKGIIHSENSSKEFLKNGGNVEILQLWVNLPARLKNVDPAYIGLQKDQIPHVNPDGGKVVIDAVSGIWEGQKGAIESLADIHLATIAFEAGGKFEIPIPENRTVLFYIINGKLNVNGDEIDKLTLVEFDEKAGTIHIEATEKSLLLIGHASPNNEPVVAQGPFVMNTRLEIQEAYADYQEGKFGKWRH
ncbi:pirin family protein [Dyadobacter sp. CY345]|uniref:pirin family protein n=1 Tax=Dyadobacter sp. CY345 TaxID=2909335 RepID=UPI001F1632EB|nr:pirin family protein [Dyadobacter sp. CY345]MCF2445501.1 pirin family protein [Dyadobacter sp. CY345]